MSGESNQRVVLVTGPSGAGRSTAVNALEDLGYEVIDNLPLSLLPRLIDGPPLGRVQAGQMLHGSYPVARFRKPSVTVRDSRRQPKLRVMRMTATSGRLARGKPGSRLER